MAAAEYGIAYKHEEHDYVDFRNQPLMPHKLIQNGPGLAVGDINGDGLDDFFIGGSGRHTGSVFIQDRQGKFKSKPLSNTPNTEDDTGALLFDADGDGDLDLYVATGGNEHAAGSEDYLHRLYKNDGSGNFQLDQQALPHIGSSGSCVTAADFDKDGDLDLFIGGRNTPKKYPLPGQSYVLRNDGGVFTDITKKVCPALEEIGMVTAALWTDFDNDSQVDLVVVGEWMPISFFKNESGRLRDVTAATGLTNTNGWWNSLVAGDFDNDGDMDYVAGNLGLNSKFKASVEEPVTVYAKDFDGNGSVDPVIGYYIQGQNYPAAARDALTDQIVSMRRRFTSYADYADVTFDKLFTQEELEGAYVARSYTFSSSYIENLGNGKFAIRALPVQAQYAPVFGMIASDYNRDSNLDLILVGNSYAADTGTGFYDASNGTLLAGNGNGGFTAVAAKAGGFTVRGDAKAMARLVTHDQKPLVLVSVNADSLKVFREQGASAYHILKIEPADAYADILQKLFSRA